MSWKCFHCDLMNSRSCFECQACFHQRTLTKNNEKAKLKYIGYFPKNPMAMNDIRQLILLNNTFYFVNYEDSKYKIYTYNKYKYSVKHIFDIDPTPFNHDDRNYFVEAHNNNLLIYHQPSIRWSTSNQRTTLFIYDTINKNVTIKKYFEFNQFISYKVKPFIIYDVDIVLNETLSQIINNWCYHNNYIINDIICIISMYYINKNIHYIISQNDLSSGSKGFKMGQIDFSMNDNDKQTYHYDNIGTNDSVFFTILNEVYKHRLMIIYSPQIISSNEYRFDNKKYTKNILIELNYKSMDIVKRVKYHKLLRSIKSFRSNDEYFMMKNDEIYTKHSKYKDDWEGVTRFQTADRYLIYDGHISCDLKTQYLVILSLYLIIMPDVPVGYEPSLQIVCIDLYLLDKRNITLHLLQENIAVPYDLRVIDTSTFIKIIQSKNQIHLFLGKQHWEMDINIPD